MMKKMTLARKIVFAEILVFILIYIFIITGTPYVVYALVCNSEAAASMSYNEQIGMRMEQQFQELQRFSSVVASDDEFNKLVMECMNEPTEQKEAKLRLYMSNIIQKYGMSTYRVLGMYLEITYPDSFETNTVGLSDTLTFYIKENVLPQYDVLGKDQMYIDPFSYSADNTSSLFGSGFTQGYGYVNRYCKNGIIGRLVIISSYDEITYIAEDMKDYCNDYVLLTSDKKIMLSGIENSKIKYNEVLNNYTYGTSYYEGYHIDKKGIYTIRNLDMGNWILIAHLSRDEVLARNITQRYTILFSVALFGIATMILTTIIINKLTEPLKEVSRQMNVISQGNFDARVSVQSQDEIGQVGKSFNIMAIKLEEMIDAIVEKEKIEQTMRYSLLISQIDPHFIYNTMNTITYLAQKGLNEDVIIVNKAMIMILRDRLRIEISEIYDTVEQELNVIEQYLIIQKYRYNGMFREKIQVEDKLKKCLILKNILQPLVENALSHGILENKDENGELLGGCITISISQEKSFLIIRVTDNGVGMSEKQLSELNNETIKIDARGEHIGIRNIKERIRYIYQSKGSISIKSTQGCGTEVIVTLPLREISKDKQ